MGRSDGAHVGPARRMVMDLFSLTIAAVLASGLMAGAHLVVWLRQREAAILWIAGAGLLAALGAVIRILAPETAAIVLANVAVFCCLACVGQACRALGGRPLSVAWFVLPSAAWIAACCWPPVLGDRELRVVLASALSALYTFWAIDEVWQDRAERQTGQLWLAGLLGVNAAGAFIRMVATEWRRGAAEPGLALDASVAVITLWSLAYVLLMAFAVLATVAERNARALQRAAHQDGLTGLGNRRQFDLALAAAGAEARASRRPLALVLVDADAFKAFNDRYGHVAGDDCLRVISAVLAGTVPGEGHVARIGGEEFAIILPGASAADALDMAEAARRGLRARAIPHEGSGHGRVTISAGIAVATPLEDATALMERADRALYEAKSTGRDRVVTAAPVLVRQAGPPRQRAA